MLSSEPHWYLPNPIYMRSYLREQRYVLDIPKKTSENEGLHDIEISWAPKLASFLLIPSNIAYENPLIWFSMLLHNNQVGQLFPKAICEGIVPCRVTDRPMT